MKSFQNTAIKWTVFATVIQFSIYVTSDPEDPAAASVHRNQSDNVKPQAVHTGSTTPAEATHTVLLVSRAKCREVKLTFTKKGNVHMKPAVPACVYTSTSRIFGLLLLLTSSVCCQITEGVCLMIWSQLKNSAVLIISLLIETQTASCPFKPSVISSYCHNNKKDYLERQ